jgi:hypothetical protein
MTSKRHPHYRGWERCLAALLALFCLGGPALLAQSDEDGSDLPPAELEVSKGGFVPQAWVEPAPAPWEKIVASVQNSMQPFLDSASEKLQKGKDWLHGPHPWVDEAKKHPEALFATAVGGKVLTVAGLYWLHARRNAGGCRPIFDAINLTPDPKRVGFPGIVTKAANGYEVDVAMDVPWGRRTSPRKRAYYFSFRKTDQEDFVPVFAYHPSRKLFEIQNGQRVEQIPKGSLGYARLKQYVDEIGLGMKKHTLSPPVPEFVQELMRKPTEVAAEPELEAVPRFTFDLDPGPEPEQVPQPPSAPVTPPRVASEDELTGDPGDWTPEMIERAIAERGGAQ